MSDEHLFCPANIGCLFLLGPSSINQASPLAVRLVGYNANGVTVHVESSGTTHSLLRYEAGIAMRLLPQGWRVIGGMLMRPVLDSELP
jgi:hypothetical protein